MIERVRDLYDLGFAIHLLHPRSKRPIESAWQSGPRKRWGELIKAYKPGMNVGVRLGEASAIGYGYLAAIDCDVKSTDPRHLKEVNDALKNIFKDAKPFPTTRSGRGNGSRHLWCLTKKPAQTVRLAQSQELVAVLMPSAQKASKRDLAALSAQEIAKGFRMRPAWEIALMGEGGQVVLPPSIHPDTGREYKWVKPIEDMGDLFVIDPPAASEPKAKAAPVASGIKPTTIELSVADMPEATRRLIEDGEGCEDRSGGMYKAAIALVRHGLGDNDIATLLSVPGTYLGDGAFEHTKSKDRSKAMRWLIKYTIAHARTEYDSANDFEPVTGDEPDEPKLSEKEAAAQKEGLALNWRDLIERGGEREGSRPRKTLRNIITILQGEFGAACFKLNEFSGFILNAVESPWAAPGEEIKDVHGVQIKVWLAAHYRFEPQVNLIFEAVSAIAQENRFHPVREYLDPLEWDGKPRIETWLKRHLSATAPDKYLRAVSRKVLCAMVARVYEPGRKFDQVLILEGPQGIGKSRSIKALAGPEWSSDAPLNLMDKDGVLAMRAVWLMELGELSGMRKADVDQLKEFISRPVDRIRVPYGRHMELFPRQCVFIGSTNNSEYLKDVTGNRRFWPVMVGECHVDALAAEREQLLAEAKFAYELGEPLWIDDDEARGQAEGEQASRVFVDEWVEVLREEFAKGKRESGFDPDRFQLKELFGPDGILGFSHNLSRADQLRAGECLRVLGYVKAMRRDNKGQWGKFWMKKGHS